MKLFFFILTAFFFSQLAISQSVLKGIVTDKTSHDHLAGATVYVSELNKGSMTNANGEYAINGFRNGSFTIQVSYLGYQSKIEKIQVSGVMDTLDIQLEVATIEVNEVVISGAYTTTQDESPQETDVINKRELKQTGASTVMDAISKVPGVNAITTGPFVSRPVIRGLSGNRILTVADGVRFETQQWDEEHGIGINELGKDRIEIIKGPACLLYGPEAMGGVIHFIEEPPASVGHVTGTMYGSLSSNNMGFQGDAELKGATEKFNWGFEALGKVLPDYYFKGYQFRAPNTRMNEIGGRGNFGITRSWGASSVSYQINQAYYGILDGKDIVKKADGSIVNKDTTEADLFPSETEAPYHAVTDHKLSSRTNLIAGASHVNIILGYQDNHRTEFEDNGTKEGYNYADMNLQSLTYDIKWSLPVWKIFSTILGMQGMHQTNKNGLQAKTQLVPDATIHDLGFMALTKLNYRQLNFTAGIRYDRRNLSTYEAHKDSTLNMPALERLYHHVSGSGGVTYDVEDCLLIRANFATGYRAPNLNELLSNGVKLESLHFELGNVNFVKEKNNEFDVSSVFKSTHFSVEAGVYLNTITNFIYLAPDGNLVNGELAGVALVPEYRFYQGNATFKGGEAGIDVHPSMLGWIHLEIKASTLTATLGGNNTYLPLMPADKICGTLFFNFREYKKFKNVFFRIGTVTTLDQYKVAVNEQKTPGYTLLNASFGGTRNIWKINNIDFTFAINNAFDKVYMDHLSRLRPFGVANQGINMVLNVNIPLDIRIKK
jgi:iron complex outermembrane receptor protein